MTENGVSYERAIKPEVEHAGFTELELADPDEITVSTKKDKIHFHNGRRNGPWSNQSGDAYNNNTGKTPFSSIAKKSLGGRTLYMLIIAGLVLFVVGLILGVLIGRFAINNGCNDSSDGSFDFYTSDEKEGQTNGSRQGGCTCPPDTCQPTAVDANPCNCSSLYSTPTTPPQDSCSICTRRNPRKSSNVKSPFAPLNKIETENVIEKIKDEGLIGPGSSLGDNYIDYIYLFPVDKASVLSYLDNNGPFPVRYAKVHVTRGRENPPDIMMYKIGPVNESIEKMTVEKLVQDSEIHFNRRSYDFKERGGMVALFRRNMDTMKKLLKESFDGTYYWNGVSVGYSTLYSLDENDRRSGCYLYLTMPTGGNTLRILPVSFIVHHPGTNTSTWYTSDYYYLNQGPFHSSQELVDAYNNGSLRKFKLPFGYMMRYRQEFNIYRDLSQPLRENSDIPPPKTYEPKGPRYTIKRNVIFWMDWQCEFSVDPIKGPAIFNVKFKGERIAYEISLQDITLLYASGTTGAGVDPPAISDTEFLLGAALRASRLGFGCPERATPIYTNVFRNKAVYDSKEVACVFEADGQRPLWRHHSKGLLDHYLVIRSPMNLGNYDYTLEFRFYLDGKIEGMSSSSGKLYGAFWDPEDPLLDIDKSLSPFGFRVGNYLSGPIHSHDFLFKVDLDILGTNNSFEKVNWKGNDIITALNTQKETQEGPGFFPFNHTRYLEFDMLEAEQGLIIDPLNPSYWTVVNENEKNKWGVKRGYRIIPKYYDGEPEQFTEHLMFGPWVNMKYHCAVTKRKDEESQGTQSLYDIRQPHNPTGGIHKMLDSENIRNEDLVLWVNAKFIHAPTSEDVPMTLGVDKGFVLKPFNYFDTTPTFDVQGHYTEENPYDNEACSEV